MGIPKTHPRIGVALIGAGMIAPTHVAALSAAQGLVKLEVVVARRPEQAEYLADTWQGAKPVFTSDLSVVADNADIKMAIVATPPSVRIDLIETLAKAGKHILLEKPVARTVGEAKQVVEICERAGVTLGILFQHRAQATSKAAADHIASGALGALGHVEIAAPLWREQSYYDELGRGTYERDGGGVLITQAIHTIDLALSLTGPVTSVQAMTATTPLHRMEAEDLAVAGLRFASGAVGSLVASTATFPHGHEVVTLHFEHGSMRVGRTRLDVFWRDGRHDVQDFGGAGEEDGGPIVAKHHLHQAVIEDFVDAIHTGRAPMATGRDGLAAHRLIDAIEASSRSGQVVNLTQ